MNDIDINKRWNKWNAPEISAKQRANHNYYLRRVKLKENTDIDNKYWIKKIGNNGNNSLILHLPMDMCKDINLISGDYVKLTIENGKIIIEKTGL